MGPDHAGDTVIALPALETLVESGRFDRITMVVNDRAATLISTVFPALVALSCPPAYQCVVKSVHHVCRVALNASLEGATDALDFRGDVISLAAMLASGASVRRGFGGRPACFVETEQPVGLEDVRFSHEFYERLAARALGLPARPVTDLLLASRRLGRALGGARPTSERRGIALCPGASTHSKSWPIDRWLALAARLAALAHPVSFIVGAREWLGLEAASSLRSISVLRDRSLLGAAANLAGARVAVTCDSALSHLAFAVSTPIVTLFGPTDPGTWFPYHLVGGGRAVGIWRTPSCHPCQRRRCDQPAPCMEELSVDDVVQGIQAINRELRQPSVGEPDDRLQ